MINFSVWKTLGVFSTILIIILFFGGTIISVGKAVSTGDWKEMLKQTGGRIFALDHSLKQETDYLLTSSQDTDSLNKYNLVFHLVYALTIVFIFFFIGMALFKFGNWLLGLKAFSPSTDIALVLLIGVAFFTLEFLYTFLTFKEIIIPFSGIWYFIKNIIPIFINLFS